MQQSGRDCRRAIRLSWCKTIADWIGAEISLITLKLTLTPRVGESTFSGTKAVFMYMGMSVCVFVCRYILCYVCTWMCLCVRRHVYGCVLHVCVYMYVFVHMCVFVWSCFCVCVYVCLCVYVFVFICLYLKRYLNIRISARGRRKRPS